MTQNLAQNADALDAANAAVVKSARECQCGNFANAETGDRINCTAETNRTFAPGHDAKLKSFLIRTGAAGGNIRMLGSDTLVTPVQAAGIYGFSHLVSAGIIKAAEKAEARANRKAARAAKKAEPKPTAPALADVVAAEEAKHAEAEAARIAEREASADWDDTPAAAPAEPLILEDEAVMNTHAREAREAAGLVKAKVGRWTREGYVNDDESFTFAKKMGGTDTVAKGKYTLV